MTTHNLIIISGPSGSGQDSVIEGLAKFLPIERVITTVSRAMRTGESEGCPYYFISRESFEQGIADGKFFEYAKQYNGEYYGVTQEEIDRVKKSDKIGIWKMDYQGVITAKQRLPGIVAILIWAPLEVLEARIRRRDNPTEAFVQERMTYSKGYFDHRDVYDYEVENKDGLLDQTVAVVKEIIEKEHRSRESWSVLTR